MSAIKLSFYVPSYYKPNVERIIAQHTAGYCFTAATQRVSEDLFFYEVAISSPDTVRRIARKLSDLNIYPDPDIRFWIPREITLAEIVEDLQLECWPNRLMQLVRMEEAEITTKDGTSTPTYIYSITLLTPEAEKAEQIKKFTSVLLKSGILSSNLPMLIKKEPESAV